MRRLAAVAIAAYALHFGWEMGHATLFAPMDRLPFWTGTAWCARAAGWDVMISATAYFAAALAARQLLWVRGGAWLPCAIYLGVGLGVTIAIEKWAITVGRWRYQEAMPTIAGIGLSPVVQWLVVPLAIAGVSRAVTRRRIALEP